ncbi:hypothetical protein C0J52_23263 [Blattella germanica]|nr:hypothetical protein C0J52_23263 [Blattella germanica]
MKRKVEVEGPEELHGMINNIPEDILFEAEAVKHDLIPEKSKDIYEEEYNKFCGGIGKDLDIRLLILAAKRRFTYHTYKYTAQINNRW